MCFFQLSRPLTLFFLGPTAYTCSHIAHMRKVFLHCGFACVIWVTEPVWRKCYIGHKNKAFCHCALACVFGDSKLEWKNICIGRMKRASRYGVFIVYVFWISKPVWKMLALIACKRVFIIVGHLVCFESLSRRGRVIVLVACIKSISTMREYVSFESLNLCRRIFTLVTSKRLFATVR